MSNRAGALLSPGPLVRASTPAGTVRRGVASEPRFDRLIGDVRRGREELHAQPPLQEDGILLIGLAPDVGIDDQIRQSRERRQQIQPYVTIVILGSVVYLAIVVMFDTFFLPVVAELAATVTATIQEPPLEINPAPLATSRRLFFHSALLQAIGNGLRLGKLTDNRLRSGVASAAVLVVLVLAALLLPV